MISTFVLIKYILKTQVHSKYNTVYGIDYNFLRCNNKYFFANPKAVIVNIDNVSPCLCLWKSSSLFAIIFKFISVEEHFYFQLCDIQYLWVKTWINAVINNMWGCPLNKWPNIARVVAKKEIKKSLKIKLTWNSLPCAWHYIWAFKWKWIVLIRFWFHFVRFR